MSEAEDQNQEDIETLVRFIRELIAEPEKAETDQGADKQGEEASDTGDK